MTTQHWVDAIQRAVGRENTVAQHLGQTNKLERRSAALSVSSKRLLRNDEQRVAGIAAHRSRNAFMEIRLVRVIGIGRRIVLGDHSDFIYPNAQFI